VPGSRLVRVTSLADRGPGTLREVLGVCGPCIVVFDVSGAIELESDITLNRGRVTLAGETSPSPGVVLHGGSLHIRASDVVVSHLGVYPGSARDAESAENRDGISVYGSVANGEGVTRVVLRNVSVAWAVDENVGLQGHTDGVRIERALLFHPLRYGGHPKGAHSMNLLLGSSVGRVIVLGSVLAGADQRNPRATAGNRLTFVNNLVVAPGAAASHLEPGSDVSSVGAIDVIGNAYVAAPYTHCRHPAIRVHEAFLSPTAATRVYLADNHVDNERKTDCLRLPPPDLPGLAAVPLTQVLGWPVIPGRDVEAAVLPFAGSHPAQRNPVDAEVVDEIRNGTVRLLDKEYERAGFSTMPVRRTRNRAAVPSSVVQTEQDVEAVRLWLCRLHRRATGLAECP
jgi:hypothetical protein